MRVCNRLLGSIAGALVVSAVSPSVAQVLYSQNFDVNDQGAAWNVNSGPTTPTPITETHDFFFDYSTVGIPAAPNSGGTTRGMKLQANIPIPPPTDPPYPGVFGGMSVSPIDQSFEGDHVLKFDWWHNYIGGDPAGVGVIGSTAGSTMLSTFGIETAGATAQRPGVSDSIFFAATGDVSSSAFRAYSSERNVSYQLPHLNPGTDVDGLGQPIDGHATHHAGTRSNNPATGGGMEVFYQNAFPSVEVPAAQTALFPETQHGSTVAGSTGFAWHEVEIKREGETVTWTVDGTLLITIDTTNYVGATGGTNILFGHSDINAGISADPYYPLTAFTLIDNIVVEAVGGMPVIDADFDDDNDVDGQDFLIWQRNLGITDGSAQNQDGDANDDGNVNAADLEFWKAGFGMTPPVAAVPEPATWALGALAVLLAIVAGLPRRRPAPVRVKARG